jgi:hypothetical protein
MPDHEIPLAISVLNGISCLSTHYNYGLLLCNIERQVIAGLEILAKKIQPVLIVLQLLELYQWLIIHTRP